MTTFTIVNDETLCDAIAQSQQQLVYVASGITRPVVEAVRQQLGCCANLQVTLIVDIDPEVYRLGYGEAYLAGGEYLYGGMISAFSR